MENLNFSEEEIEDQLALLGYKNIPKHRLREFKRDLDQLILHGDWKNLASPAQVNGTKPETSRPSPPAYTKEKVSRFYYEEDVGEGFFLHAGPEEHDRPGRCDSYARHSVAPRLRLPPGAPGRLHVEPEPDSGLDPDPDPDPDDSRIHPPLTDSYTSSPESPGRRFIKRKVLRKHNGQSLVCDESIYSDDSAGAPLAATMYKMYNAQSDSDDDDKDSLNSSFWSDRERREEDDDDDEEEVVVIERPIREEDSKPVGGAEESVQEEKPELSDTSGEGSERQSDGDDSEDGDEEEEEEEDGDEGESRSSSCESPAPSLMTSGYGTYRPEEPDSVMDRTITEFDQDSRGDLSDTRDDEDEEEEDEDERSLCSFGGFDLEPSTYSETRPVSPLTDGEPGAEAMSCREEDEGEEVEDVVKSEEERAAEDPHEAAESEAANTTSAEQRHFAAAAAQDGFVPDATPSDGVDAAERRPYEEAEEEKRDVEDDRASEDPDVEDDRASEDPDVEDDRASEDPDMEDDRASEDPDESCSNRDIKFIDSKADFSRMTFDQLCEAWEAELRPPTDAASCLEDRLAELRLSPPARRDFETDYEDATSPSETPSSEGLEPLSAFESYIRGMTRAQSDGDVRPKPKSFIRPVVKPQTRKKTDPVAKYFQYKQLWEMFKLPGEADRRAVRLDVRDRLAFQPPPPKPRRVYRANTYVVPTDKKRSALRWEIRTDLANGLLPSHKFSYRF